MPEISDAKIPHAVAATSPAARRWFPLRGTKRAGRRRATAIKPLPTLAIVGGGMAAHRVCRQMIARGGQRQYRMIVFADESRPPYDRVRLTDFFHRRNPDYLLLDAPDWYRQHGIDLRLGAAVTAIKPQPQVVQAARDQVVHYDRLILATGSRPLLPPIAGTEHEGVFVYRTLDHLQAILARRQVSQRAVVIGGGLLGLEAARALHELGLDTVVVEMADYLMPRQLDPEGAALLLAEVERQGVQVLLGRQTERIDKTERGLTLCFRAHAPLTVDMVVISAGIAPRGELAAAAGLHCTPRGAIVVDDRLQTSDPNIYAIGECAAHRNQVYGLAAPAFAMADVVVDRLLGKQQAIFTGADLSTRLKLLGVDVTVLGDYLQPGDIEVHRAAGVYRKLVLKQGRLVGTIAVGAWGQIGQVQSAVQVERRIGKRHLNRFRATGSLWGNGVQPIQQWPAPALVCNCCRVSKGDLVRARQGGALSLAALARATGATTVCGACRPLVAELAEAPEIFPPAASVRGLKWAAIAGMIVALLLMLLPPLPIAASVQARWHDIESFRRHPITRQITGYALLALALAALALSLRKRSNRFAFGSFGAWRLAHALLGVGTLVGLVAHTGLRFGHNLNFVLMAVFVGLNLLGTAAGWVAASEAGPPGPLAHWARRWRPLMTLLHILLVWPLPALLTFHILAVYYY